MKKASLITIHSIDNFGSVLQTIATVEILKRHGVDTTVINYQRNQDKLFHAFSCKGQKKLISKILTIALAPISIVRICIYRKFLKDRVAVSKAIFSRDDFREVCPKADLYITGSDQVWNSVHNAGLDKHYYFEGFPEGIVKIAFSASFGRPILDDDEYTEVKRMLRSYKAISVREKSAKKIVESMGYQAVHILDPTMMINRKQWFQYAEKRRYAKPYIFIYAPYNIRDINIIYQSARKIAKKRNLEIVAYSNGILPNKDADRTLCLSNPGRVLSAFYYADYVITNSFHGTAFSINLNREFFVYMPTGFGNRISSLLEMCTLEDRLLAPGEVVSDEKLDTGIDYGSVNVILEKERQKVQHFFTKALSD